MWNAPTHLRPQVTKRAEYGDLKAGRLHELKRENRAAYIANQLEGLRRETRQLRALNGITLDPQRRETVQVHPRALPADLFGARSRPTSARSPVAGDRDGAARQRGAQRISAFLLPRAGQPGAAAPVDG